MTKPKPRFGLFLWQEIQDLKRACEERREHLASSPHDHEQPEALRRLGVLIELMRDELGDRKAKADRQAYKFAARKWKRIRNPQPKKWPGIWVEWIVSEGTTKTLGATCLQNLHGYIGQGHAETIRHAVQQGKKRGTF